MSKDNLEQKAILIDLMNNEPLMSAEEFIRTLTKKYSLCQWMEKYADYKSEWYLKQVEKIVCEDVRILKMSDNSKAIIIDKQSITNAFDNYITNNLK